jgi:succinylarginine dihydrolase
MCPQKKRLRKHGTSQGLVDNGRPLEEIKVPVDKRDSMENGGPENLWF